ncbi:uncharacterized protein LOC144350255 [Saccoglossus kowalevskii]
MVLTGSVIQSSTCLGTLEPQLRLAMYAQEELDQAPITVDADELVSNPRHVLEKFCSEVRISFSESMLNWEPGNVAPFVVKETLKPPIYDLTYKSAVESSTFLREMKTDHSMQFFDELPNEIKKFIEKPKPIYEELLKFKKMKEEMQSLLVMCLCLFQHCVP